MANFTVDKNVRVVVTSTVDAANPQRFIIERESPTSPGFWEGMGKRIYAGGESASFVSHSAITNWRITCQNKDGGWRFSRENLVGVGTPQIIIYCDDDYNGDSDFNDIVVRVNLGYFVADPKGIISQNIDTSTDEDGDGNFMKQKPLKDNWVTKKPNTIEP